MKTLMMALLAFGMAYSALPVQAEECDPNDTDNCQVITGPGSAEVQGIGSVGVGLCQTASADVPIFCEAAPGAIGGSGAGAATFDSDWPVTDGNHEIRIDIWYQEEIPCTATAPACGFNALICNDRNLNSACTNVGNFDDELENAYSAEPITDVDCGDGKKDDEKDCEDNNGASLAKTVCFSPTIFSGVGTLDDENSTGAWNNADQFVVFVGNWAGKVDEGDPNVGIGVSAGTYYVGFTDNGPCTIPPTPPVQPTGCIWDAETPDNSATPFDAQCENAAGQATVFTCSGGVRVLAFIVGGSDPTGTPATVTTAPVTGGCPVVTTTSVDEEPITGAGTFECHVTNVVGAASFGCITLFN